MPWINIKPENLGGGRTQKAPAAKLYESGQFVINHAAVTMLGDPPRVRVQIDPDARLIRLTPATPTDTGAFALAGGGNAQHRLGMKAVASKWPMMCTSYTVVRIAGGIECRPVAAAEDD